MTDEDKKIVADYMNWPELELAWDEAMHAQKEGLTFA